MREVREDKGVDWLRVGIALQSGTVVAGRYRLERLIGQGGMGAVWAATHTLTRRAVAIKFVKGSAHGRAELRRRFMREALAATAVKHPNVVDVLDLFELDDETPVMVMDLLTGETLGARIEREERLGIRETATLLLPAVSAIGTAHARGIVHRDLKPDNIFLARGESGEDSVKVLDFGIAKLSAANARAGDTGGTGTQAGSTLGTPCYMAPEQATAEKDLDHRVDIWALGVIFYECLSGVRPIDGESVGQVVMRLMSTGIMPLERVVLGLPEEISRMVGRMLSRERSKRPDDLREVAALLKRYSDVSVPEFGAPGTELSAASHSGLVGRPEYWPAAPRPSTHPGSRRVRTMLLASVALALAFGSGAWVFRASPAQGSKDETRLAAESRLVPVVPKSAPPNQKTTSALGETSVPSSAPEPSAARLAPSRVRRTVTRATAPSQPSADAPAPLPGLAETPPF